MLEGGIKIKWDNLDLFLLIFLFGGRYYILIFILLILEFFVDRFGI